MTKFKTFAAIVATALIAIACTANQVAKLPVPPAQLAAQICPPIAAANQAFVVVDPTIAPKIAEIQPVIDAVCKPGASVDLTSIDTLNKTAIPVLLNVIGSLAIPPAQAEELRLGLIAAQLVASEATAVGVAK